MQLGGHSMSRQILVDPMIALRPMEAPSISLSRFAGVSSQHLPAVFGAAQQRIEGQWCRSNCRYVCHASLNPDAGPPGEQAREHPLCQDPAGPCHDGRRIHSLVTSASSLCIVSMLSTIWEMSNCQMAHARLGSHDSVARWPGPWDS